MADHAYTPPPLSNHLLRRALAVAGAVLTAAMSMMPLRHLDLLAGCSGLVGRHA